jgi:TonB family protein
MRRFCVIALTLALATSLGHAQQTRSAADAPLLTGELIAKGKINPPKPINTPEAHFSDEARRNMLNGLCLVSLIVDVNGMPQNLKLVRCTDPSFEQTSLEAVQQYRFKPATTQEGKPVPLTIQVVINYHLYDGVFKHSTVGQTPIRCTFITPPGTTTSTPGPDGIYPLTSSATPPTVIKFSDEGYGVAAFLLKGNGACDIVLTISAKGKASDPAVTHCERPSLETPAIQSLLKSLYKPGQVNGKAVAIRTSIHLELADLSPDYTAPPPEDDEVPPEY